MQKNKNPKRRGAHGLTHFQELIEQAEGVSIFQVIVAQPVLQFAGITRVDAAVFVTTRLPVTPTALPLHFLHSPPAQVAHHPAGKQTNKQTEK